jgi:hypothetical protein
MSCLDVDEVLSPDGGSIIHASLQALYAAYRKSSLRAGRTPRRAIEWLAMGHRGRRLDAVLSVIGLNNWRQLRSGLRSSNPIMIDLLSLPRPHRFFNNGQPTQRLRQLRQLLTDGDTARKLRDRLGNLFDANQGAIQILRTTREVSLGYMNILKGNIAEVLSMPRQLYTLNVFNSVPPGNAVLITDLRAQIGGTGAPRLFTDNIIGRVTADGNLEVLHVFEVKSSLNGGVDGINQVLRWDDRIRDGVILHLPADARVFRMGSGSGTRAPMEVTAQRYIQDVARTHSRSSRGAFTFGSSATGSRALNLREADRSVLAALNRGSLPQASLTDSGLSVSQLAPTDFSLSGLDSVSAYGPDVARMELDVSHDEIEFLAVSILLDS